MVDGSHLGGEPGAVVAEGANADHRRPGHQTLTGRERCRRRGPARYGGKQKRDMSRYRMEHMSKFYGVTGYVLVYKEDLTCKTNWAMVYCSFIGF